MILLFLLIAMTGVSRCAVVRFDLTMSTGRTFRTTRGTRIRCGMDCGEDENCKGYTYDVTAGVCFLKEEASDVIEAPHEMYVATHQNGMFTLILKTFSYI